MTIILLVCFFILLILNVPIAFCMLISSLVALLYAGVNPIMVGLETARSLASFYTFLAVPFFILAGEIMSYGGLSKRLVQFVKSMVGHHKNGLPAVTTISSQLFGAVSGASAATCAAVGGVMIPAMEKQGFKRTFSTALAACSGTTGALIPPSIVLVIYGTVANVSIEKLFVGGVIPGLVVGLGLILVSWNYSRKREIIKEQKSSLSEIGKSLYESFFTLFLGVIIFGGIILGIFTATEASAVAVIYAAFIGLFVYKKLKLKDLPKILLSSAKLTAALSFLIACASLFAWTLSIGNVPAVLTSNLVSFSESVTGILGTSLSPETLAILKKVIILLVLNISLLMVGMFIDIAPALLIVVPVVLPISEAIGMAEGLAAIHFGVMVVANLIIGLVTPPVGSTLFVASAVGKTDILAMTPYVLRFLGIMLIVQLMITFIPAITTYLPSFMG
ncbi:TRAP transporter large permease [Aliifodinibius sp. S!AR15-10]|uniref:TRAP transporter large permease n=1 Tax=Aliifodinibius sp. S!AR15-10 TaxID=2950437 RepID=UPI002865E131|nr:TRAP transporter large permease [Aliifodinibius sp. S!AR15-10]MDR8390635.1 TRAP transporter large permease [Aliifodinibius sp. S!AR15-10]